MAKGPKAREEKGAWSCLCPPELTYTPKGHAPVKWGLGGKPPMSAASGIALIEGDPQRIFGYFLCEQKVTYVSPMKKINPLPLTAEGKTDKMFWQIRKTAWKRRSTRL